MFDLIYLERHTTEDAALQDEKRLIESWNTLVPDGYNMLPGGTKDDLSPFIAAGRKARSQIARSRRREVIGPDGRIYNSRHEASSITHLTPACVYARAKKQLEGWRFANEPIASHARSLWRKVYGPSGEEYRHQSAAASAFRVSVSTISHWCSNSINGWRFDGDPVRPHLPHRQRGHNNCLAVVGPNGTIYPSQAEAARQNNISCKKMCKLIKINADWRRVGGLNAD